MCGEYCRNAISVGCFRYGCGERDSGTLSGNRKLVYWWTFSWGIDGGEDGVLNREKYEENKVYLPEDFEEIVIDGGCHAYFGTYGAQDGDGIPDITNEEQIEMTVEMIVDMVF